MGTSAYEIWIGITAYPTLMDSGYVTVPSIAIFGKDSKCIVENEGVYADIEVENYPKDVIAGNDPQLEKAVEAGMKDIKPRTELQEPPAPIWATER